MIPHHTDKNGRSLTADDPQDGRAVALPQTRDHANLAKRYAKIPRTRNSGALSTALTLMRENNRVREDIAAPHADGLFHSLAHLLPNRC